MANMVHPMDEFDPNVEGLHETTISGPANNGEHREAVKVFPPNQIIEASFITDVPVEVRVVSAETFRENKKIWYKIDVTHGPFSWTLYKTLSDVISLEMSISSYKTWSRLRRRGDAEIMKELADAEEHQPGESIRSLPFIRSSREFEDREHIKEVIQIYLNHVTRYNMFRTHASMSKFFDLSGYSFHPALGGKGEEGFLKKYSPCGWFSWSKWHKRWFICKDSFIMYLDSTKRDIEGVFLFDRNTLIAKSDEEEKVLNLTNSSFQIEVKFPNPFQENVWQERFQRQIDFFKSQFHHSRKEYVTGFAPPRNAPVHWFVDGSSFFSAIADALEKAKEEIFIGGFLLGPFIYMRRSNGLTKENNLLTILKRKADEGVKIYILIHDDISTVSNQGEAFAREVLEKANSENISIVAHGGELFEGALLWVHHEKIVIVDQGTAFVSGIDLAYGRWDDHRHLMTDIGSPSISATNTEENTNMDDGIEWNAIPGQLWRGIDYANDYKSAISDFSEPFKDILDRKKVPRMPWHDVGSVAYHEAARDVARHFIERWNYVRATERRDEKSIPFLLPKAPPNVEDKLNCYVHPHAIEAKVQVIRSASKWSVGVEVTEQSVQDAYIKAIEKSEHYIYIENQFFISIRNHPDVENKIVEALYQRIERAKRENKKFRLYVMMPLIPGFEGDFSKDDHSEIIQMISHFQYQSISRGEGSLISSLRKIMSEEEINNYISFCALRAHGELNGEPITEVLYVHSKLMIVDDKLSIIGSANINDRSLNGDRDSEVCLLVEDTEMVDSVMDGRPYEVGKFSSTLRKRVFAEHLGFLPEDYDESPDFDGSDDISDIVGDDFFHGTWNDMAAFNTEIYKEAFRSVPADTVRRFSQVSEYQRIVGNDSSTKRDLLNKLKGNLVQFPMRYLENEDLQFQGPSPYKLLPIKMWT